MSKMSKPRFQKTRIALALTIVFSQSGRSLFAADIELEAPSDGAIVIKDDANNRMLIYRDGRVEITGLPGSAQQDELVCFDAITGELGACTADALQGPTGAAGATGSAGVAGATGSLGPTGPTGGPGPAGATGAQGTDNNVTGPIGANRANRCDRSNRRYGANRFCWGNRSPGSNRCNWRDRSAAYRRAKYNLRSRQRRQNSPRGN